ncbi:3-oxoacyl-ACP synthase [Escherichia coli]|uniref:3-oxoacyl-ACP synthase n=1 Tax=Escherichia coli TaxID=562 RepID=A0A2X3JL82_ECOLX|nr:3-oxoacyl-ACP synthase [Escherichia coli]
MSKRRVVVTGLGMLSPVGNTVESTWKALLAGQSGISLIDHFDTSAYATKFAGLVKDFNCEDIISRKEQRKDGCLHSIWNCRWRSGHAGFWP